MISKRFFFASTAAAVALAVAGAVSAQDDIYRAVRFVNDSDRAAEVKIWNPRAGGQFSAKVEAGQSLDVKGTDGKPMRMGVISSRVQVNGGEAKGVGTVGAEKDGTHVIIWTKEGFKPRE